jgi:O-antigen/teichoic acid export membrane protein
MSSAASSAPGRAGLFKDIARGSGIYFLGIVLQRLAGILMIPITTRCLTPADYGIADLLEQTTSALSLLLGLGLSSSLGYFYFRSDSPEERRTVASTTILGATMLGLVATLVCQPFSAPLARLVFRDPSASRYFRVLFFAFPLSFAVDAMSTLLRVENRPGTYTLMSGLRLGLRLIGVIVLVALLGLRVTGLVWTSLITGAISTAVLAAYWRRSLKLKFDLAVFIRTARYASPLALGGLAMLFLHVGDRFLLPHYRPMSDLGIYVLAYKFGILVSYVYSTFQIYWSAQAFQIMRRADSDAVFTRIFTYVSAGLSFIGLALIVLSRPALRIMAGPAFQGAAELVPVIVIAYCFRSVGDFLRCLFLTEGRPSYDAICSWLGAGLCLAGYVFLIPKYGIWGAAYATVASFAVMTVVAVVWTYRLRPYRVERRRLLKIGIALAVAILPHLASRGASLSLSIGLAVLSVALFPSLLLLLRFPTPGELKTGRAILARMTSAAQLRSL